MQIALAHRGFKRSHRYRPYQRRRIKPAHFLPQMAAAVIPKKIDGLTELNAFIRTNVCCTSDVVQRLYCILPHLEALDAMVGLKEFKRKIVDHVLYYAQSLHGGDYMHTVLTGNPGTGKTEVAHILARIFAGLGVLKSGCVKKVARSELVGTYLGETAVKTTDVVMNALDGVLFIDEAYSLGPLRESGEIDSYSKECMDTLNELLSIHRNRLLVIIAGYEADLERSFFGQNPGLRSRFPWRHSLCDYDTSELASIFKKNVRDAGWTLSCDVDKSFKDVLFKDNGRDVANLFARVKIAHSRRLFLSSLSMVNNDVPKEINAVDLESGMVSFREGQEGFNEADVSHIYL